MFCINMIPGSNVCQYVFQTPAIEQYGLTLIFRKAVY